MILVSGPTDLPVPEGVDWVPVRTTEEMRGAVTERAPKPTVVVMAAAVADYRPDREDAEDQARGERLDA